LKKQLVELALILLGVWSVMILIFVTIELIIVPFDGYSGSYLIILLAQIAKIATAGMLVGIWLLSWYRLTYKYFWRRVKEHENMA